MRKMAIPLLCMLLVCSCSYWDMWTEADSVQNGTGTTNATESFSGDAPSSLTATKAMYGSSVKLSWSSVTGADYYEIQKGTTSSSDTPDSSDVDWAKISASVTGTSYTDSDVESGTYYVYRVRAKARVNSSTVSGDYSPLAVGYTLSAPSSISASKGGSASTISLSWDKLDEASLKGYKLEYSYDGNSWLSADSSISSSAVMYTFAPVKSYYGKSIYFRMYSTARNGEESEASGAVLGYTLSDDAPAQPSADDVLGTDSGQVTIKWTAGSDSYDEDELYWEILRSSSTESDVSVFSTMEYDELESDDDGYYVFSDTSAEAGVEYTYTIRAITEDGVNGLPLDITGYLLSPPGVESGYGMAQSDDGTWGFSFTLTDAVGAADHTDWVYYVYGSEDGSVWDSSALYTFSASDDDLSVFYAYDGETYACQYFTTRTYDSTYGYSEYLHETAVNNHGPISFAASDAAENLWISENLYISTMSADDSGNYPIIATMDENADIDFYRVRVWEDEPSSAEDSGYSEKEVYPEYYSDGVVVLYDIVDSPVTGWTYYVAVQGVDYLERESDWSDILSGYAAITDDKLILLMQAYATKAWSYIDQPIMTDGPWGSAELNNRWKNSAIREKVEASSLSSLGSVTESGLSSGTIYYSTGVTSGLNGIVTFRYTDYSDVGDWFVIDGENTMEVNIKGSGSTEADYTLSGYYPASVVVSSDKMKIVSNEAVGVYIVKQSGREEAEVDVNTDYEGASI